MRLRRIFEKAALTVTRPLDLLRIGLRGGCSHSEAGGPSQRPTWLARHGRGREPRLAGSAQGILFVLVAAGIRRWFAAVTVLRGGYPRETRGRERAPQGRGKACPRRPHTRLTFTIPELRLGQAGSGAGDAATSELDVAALVEMLTSEGRSAVGNAQPETARTGAAQGGWYVRTWGQGSPQGQDTEAPTWSQLVGLQKTEAVRAGD